MVRFFIKSAWLPYFGDYFNEGSGLPNVDFEFLSDGNVAIIIHVND